MDLDNRSHICPSYFQYLNCLPVEKRVHQKTLSHVFKIKSGTVPDYLQKHPVSLVHIHSTRLIVTACASANSTLSFTSRDSGCFSLPKVKGFEKFCDNEGCNLWNDLLFHIKHISAPNDHIGYPICMMFMIRRMICLA